MSLLSYDHISTILSQPASLEWIRQTLAATPCLELDTLSVVVCLHFGFSDEHGQLGLGPCAEVLRDLGRAFSASQIRQTAQAPAQKGTWPRPPCQTRNQTKSKARDQARSKPKN